MELKEEMVSQETVYQGIIVNVRRDKAKLPDGRLTNREVVEHPGGVAIFAMDDQDRVAMVRQYRYPMGEIVLELPAGKLEKGEDPRDSGLRELREETGLIARPENGQRLFRFAHPDGFSDVWLFKQDFNLDDVVFPPGETCGAQCASPERILEMQSEGLLVPYDYLPELFARAKD